MDKWEAQYSLWSSFGYPAYDANSVPDGENKPDFPYITYNGVDGTFGSDTLTSVSIWTRDFSWRPADRISNTIHQALKDGGVTVSYEGGVIWVTPETPFSQNLGDPNDDLIRRKVLNVTIHFA